MLLQRLVNLILRMKNTLYRSAASLLIAAPLICIAAPSSKDITAVLTHLYGLQPSYTQCLNEAADSIGASLQCMIHELDFQNKRLNKAYQSLIAKLDSALQVRLKSEENVWMQYRDFRCALVVDGINRPEQESLACKIEETGKQATDLEARLFVQ